MEPRPHQRTCSVLPAAAASSVAAAGQKAASATSAVAPGTCSVASARRGCASSHSRTDQSADAVRKWAGLKGDQQTCRGTGQAPGWSDRVHQRELQGGTAHVLASPHPAPAHASAAPRSPPSSAAHCVTPFPAAKSPAPCLPGTQAPGGRGMAGRPAPTAPWSSGAPAPPQCPPVGGGGGAHLRDMQSGGLPDAACCMQCRT